MRAAELLRRRDAKAASRLPTDRARNQGTTNAAATAIGRGRRLLAQGGDERGPLARSATAGACPMPRPPSLCPPSLLVTSFLSPAAAKPHGGTSSAPRPPPSPGARSARCLRRPQEVRSEYAKDFNWDKMRVRAAPTGAIDGHISCRNDGRCFRGAIADPPRSHHAVAPALLSHQPGDDGEGAGGGEHGADAAAFAEDGGGRSGGRGGRGRRRRRRRQEGLGAKGQRGCASTAVVTQRFPSPPWTRVPGRRARWVR